MAIIGIDLGTTNSLVAYFDGEKPVVIPNSLGENLTPSVISIAENGEVFVGAIARERLLTHPKDTVTVFKRSMGSKKIHKLGGQNFLPEELSALVIRKLKEDAEQYLGSCVEEVIISVPAYFSDAQRKATKRAGEIAGLKVERIINEPSAAAIAYGIHNTKEHTQFLVFDLGGGTFDISILQQQRGLLEVRSVAGDNFLGGEDFTVALMSLFIEKNSIVLGDLDIKTYARLKKSAEQAKIRFADSQYVKMQCIIDEKVIESEMSLKEYKERCTPLFKRLQRPMERAITDAEIKLHEIDHIILVGGGTKLKLIHYFVSKLFGRLPDFGIDPVEAVVKGVAVQAGLEEKHESLQEVILTDVCPYTLGTEIAIPRPDEGYDGGYFHPIIERNTPIPVSHLETLYTLKDKQEFVTVEILQGENRLAKDNIHLAKLQIPVPVGNAGNEAVDVRYTYDKNGILEVEVTVKSTGYKKSLVIENSPGFMSKEEIEERLKLIAHIKMHPRERESNMLMLARGERLYQETMGKLRQYIGDLMVYYEQVLDQQDERKVLKATEELGKIFGTIESKRLF